MALVSLCACLGFSCPHILSLCPCLGSPLPCLCFPLPLPWPAVTPPGPSPDLVNPPPCRSSALRRPSLAPLSVIPPRPGSPLPRPAFRQAPGSPSLLPPCLLCALDCSLCFACRDAAKVEARRKFVLQDGRCPADGGNGQKMARIVSSGGCCMGIAMMPKRVLGVGIAHDPNGNSESAAS
eukprot:355453-Chlamydomonas_euryale.AAC.3